MQIVVDIPKYVYDTIIAYDGYISDCDNEKVGNAIKNGTQLSKGHGRIGDLDAVYKDICNGIEAMTDVGMPADGQYLWGKLNDALDNAPTIIEADTAVEE